MNTVIEMDELKEHLKTACSEKVVRALKRFVSGGMQLAPEYTGTSGTWQNELLKVKCSIASDPETSHGLLSRLARSPEVLVLERVAENPRTDAHTLACLATSQEAAVREAVAENSKTPLATLIALAFDENIDVRFRLAENHNAPRQVLDLLAQDDNPYVSWRAGLTIERLASCRQSPLRCAA